MYVCISLVSYYLQFQLQLTFNNFLVLTKLLYWFTGFSHEAPHSGSHCIVPDSQIPQDENLFSLPMNFSDFSDTGLCDTEVKGMRFGTK